MASPTHIIFRRLVAALEAGDPSLVMLPESAQDATARGAKRFFTGRQCKHGHVAHRYVSGGICSACDAAFRTSERGRATERARQRQDEYRAWKRKYEARAYHEKPEFRLKGRVDSALYRAAKIKAAPPWLTDEQRADIKAFYTEAARLTRETGIPHQVDHIIPLTHPDVQGLHVPWNLQILTKAENQSKLNKFDGTMENEGWRRT